MSIGNSTPSLKFLSDNVLPDPHCLAHLSRAMEDAHSSGILPYGRDDISREADMRLRSSLGFEHGDTRFLATGTAANAFAVAALTSRCARVLCADTAHVWQLEAGAVDRLAQVRLDPIPAPEGKLTVELLARALRCGSVNPGQHLPVQAVVISQPTELGFVYSLAELRALSQLCRAHALALIVDGARIPYAAAALNEPLRALTQYADAVTLSLPKIGGLFGALAVFRTPLQQELTTLQKSIGQAVDTTWSIAAQVNYLFSGNALQNCCARSNRFAAAVAAQLRELSFPISFGGANTLFVELEQQVANAINERFRLYEWQRLEHSRGLYRIVVGPTAADNDTRELIECFRAQREYRALANG